MRQIKAELILASKNAITGHILYTFLLTFPRIILAEVNTHTIASKNTSSSRAIPVPKLMKMVWEDPFIPITWGTYQKGMQAGPPLTGFKRSVAVFVWRFGRLFDLAEGLFDHYVLHLAKEVTNRIYERFIWTEQVFSTTDLENLMHLRDHWMAEPHFQELAKQMHRIKSEVEDYFLLAHHSPGMEESVDSVRTKCQILYPGQWHLPFVGKWLEASKLGVAASELVKVSSARCAWVSYFMPGDDSKKMFDFTPAYSTYAKLAESDPKHLSPTQHPATPIPIHARVGNYAGFLQHRKMVDGESGGDPVLMSITPKQALESITEWSKQGSK